MAHLTMVPPRTAVVCAWCQDVMTDGVAPVSHSICPPCGDCMSRQTAEIPLGSETGDCTILRRHLVPPPSSPCPRARFDRPVVVAVPRVPRVRTRRDKVADVLFMLVLGCATGWLIAMWLTE